MINKIKLILIVSIVFLMGIPCVALNSGDVNKNQSNKTEQPKSSSSNLKKDDEKRRQQAEAKRRLLEAEERQRQEEAERRQQAETKRRQREAEERQRQEAERRQQAEEERLQREAEEKLRQEAEAIRKQEEARDVVLQNLIDNMVYVEGGTFKMGVSGDESSAPVHNESVNSFLIGKYEVTQKEWNAVMDENPSVCMGSYNPVDNVSWNDCQKFIEKLNEITGMRFRLPTVAEWEYAARGGKHTHNYMFSGSNDIDNVAWYTGNSRRKTHTVGTKEPNELGLYDMSGNVNEWTSSNGWTEMTKVYRIFRGGSCYGQASDASVTTDDCLLPRANRNDFGFRLVLEKDSHNQHIKMNQQQKEELDRLQEEFKQLQAYDLKREREAEQERQQAAERKRQQIGNLNPVIQNLIANMVNVEGGSFMMGSKDDFSARPVHEETVASFSIGKYEVTQKEWEAVMGEKPSRSTGEDKPVEEVSWDDCMKFIKKLNSITGMDFRLPTEVEWEYAARGGNRSKGYKYSGSNDIKKVAWYEGNTPNRTRNVGMKEPNELGLYDMTGNVEEWTSSYWCYHYDEPRNSSEIVCRGGDVYDNKDWCLVSKRRHNVGWKKQLMVGFRLAL